LEVVSRRSYVRPTSGANRDLGAAFRHFRKARRITQAGLALSAGFSRSYIGLVEGGLTSARWGNIVRLAKALDVPLMEILRRAVEGNPKLPRGGR
jgi:transcriptional regulator with XRE-family HTH domain